MLDEMKDSQYEQSLLAMIHLLKKVGEDQWLKWIEEDLRLWRGNRDTSHHLSAYGGMGSFNDVIICSMNQHQVTDQQDPWANNLFNWIKSICHFLAKQPCKSFSAKDLSRSIGIYDAPLSAFVGGENAPDSMRGSISSDIKLQGWRCLECGYSEISRRALESMLSDIVLPGRIFKACEVNGLVQLIDDALSFKLPGTDELRGLLRRKIEESDIYIIDRDGCMRPCPECKSEDTAVYRWVSDPEDETRFIPSKDNLPLRPRRA